MWSPYTILNVYPVEYDCFKNIHPPRNTRLVLRGEHQEDFEIMEQIQGYPESDNKKVVVHTYPPESEEVMMHAYHYENDEDDLEAHKKVGVTTVEDFLKIKLPKKCSPNAKAMMAYLKKLPSDTIIAIVWTEFQEEEAF